MDTVLWILLFQLAIKYMDNVVTFSNAFEKSSDQLCSVFHHYRELKVSLKLKKSLFIKDHFDYSGHVIKCCGLCISVKETDKTHGPQHPTNLSEANSFLGLSNLFRQFSPNVAHIASLLDSK